MARSEFSRKTKQAAWARSGGLCEASGAVYGLPEGKRCWAPLSRSVIYDHEDPDANSKDNSLENARCICPVCNKFKTFKRDIPMIAKRKRLADNAIGIRAKQSRPMPGSRASGWKKPFYGNAVRRT